MRTYLPLAGIPLLVVGLLVAGCGRQSAPKGVSLADAPPVVVAKAETKRVPLILDSIGAVEPIHTAALRSQVTGTLRRIHFQEGREVQEGEVLFSLDARTFESALREAEAVREKTQVQYETARADSQRYRQLSEKGTVSTQQLQAAVDNERALRAALTAAEAAVESDRLQLEFCTIRAPFAGRTGSLGAHEGDLVRAGDTAVTLVVVNQFDPIYVSFALPEQQLATLRHYASLGPIPATAIPRGTGSLPATGQLTFIDNSVDPTTGTVRVKATFPNPDSRLWPSQSVAVHLRLAEPVVLAVPAAAVQSGQQGRQVFVIRADGTAELRPVVVERIAGGDAVITAGLQAGETVVVDGQMRLRTGRPVTIVTRGGTNPAGP